MINSPAALNLREIPLFQRAMSRVYVADDKKVVTEKVLSLFEEALTKPRTTAEGFFTVGLSGGSAVGITIQVLKELGIDGEPIMIPRRSRSDDYVNKSRLTLRSLNICIFLHLQIFRNGDSSSVMNELFRSTIQNPHSERFEL